MLILGITGTLGAGKGTVVEYLVRRHGFAHFSAREVIVEEIKKRGLPENRDTMREVANDLRAQFGVAYVLEQLFKKAAASGVAQAVLESVRTLGEIEMLRKIKGAHQFYLWGVDADPKARYERNRVRGTTTDDVSFEDFLRQERLESIDTDPAKINLPACLKRADFVLDNNGTKKELYRQVGRELEKVEIKGM